MLSKNTWVIRIFQSHAIILDYRSFILTQICGLNQPTK